MASKPPEERKVGRKKAPLRFLPNHSKMAKRRRKRKERKSKRAKSFFHHAHDRSKKGREGTLPSNPKRADWNPVGVLNNPQSGRSSSLFSLHHPSPQHKERRHGHKGGGKKFDARARPEVTMCRAHPPWSKESLRGGLSSASDVIKRNIQ